MSGDQPLAASSTPDAGRVDVRAVQKRFGNVHALRGVDLAVTPGTVHALIGENGAGKSTLAKIIAGVQRPDAGTLQIAGREVSLTGPRDGLANGVAIIAQELMLAPQLSVMDNVFLGMESHSRGVLRKGTTARRYRELVEQTGFELPGDTPVSSLRVAEQQTVEIMRAIARDVRIIVMDEPTAALSRDQAERLFEIVRSFRDRGMTVIYVSHFLKEVLALADRITVMRDGLVVSTKPVGDHTQETLVTDMLGAPMDMTFPAKRPPAADAPMLAEFRELRRAPYVNGVSFAVRHGEILGLAGLVGAGRTECARLIFGVDGGTGTVTMNGDELQGLIATPGAAMEHGIGLVPESRKDQGLFLRRSVVENITLAGLKSVSRLGVVSRRDEQAAALRAIEQVDIRSGGPNTPVGNLSGGNQQKVLFARWMFRRPDLLIVDEPTRGVDIGAKRAIYELLAELASEGTAIILISSELEEVIGLAHRVIAMRLGVVTGVFDGENVTERQVLDAIFATDVTNSAGALQESHA
jgi:simple sugar transport system ATP-binding protein/ribose transport system ATP-binding protein